MDAIIEDIATTVTIPTRPRKDCENLLAYLNIPVPDVIDACSKSSRVGRKNRRKSYDYFYCKLMRKLNIPALAGKPIPGSEKTGQRQYYEKGRMIRGNATSARVRGEQSRQLVDKVRRLAHAKHSIKRIAAIAGKSIRHCQRILSGWRPRVNSTGGGLSANVTTPCPVPSPQQTLLPPRQANCKLSLYYLYILQAEHLLESAGDRMERNRLTAFLKRTKRFIGKYKKGIRLRGGDAQAKASQSYAASLFPEHPIAECVRKVNHAFGGFRYGKLGV